METSHAESRSRLRAKAPEIAASLDAVRMLQAKAAAGEDATAFFSLADQVYARARVAPQNRVRGISAGGAGRRVWGVCSAGRRQRAGIE